ncbi:MAG: hypothetical protein NZT92_01085 [Abditibacteriales bacterium]|nr:hypothetical protein [Abditibacteriales bacterium]MDW8364413.1 hypothetical protein [Abditibacteriales bacterium]
MKHVFVIVGVLSFVSAISSESPSPSLDDLAARIKPKPAEETWKMIPWRTSLVEGQRLARELNRPMLVWISSEEPLERC